jgi:hypothetical protein
MHFFLPSFNPVFPGISAYERQLGQADFLFAQIASSFSSSVTQKPPFAGSIACTFHPPKVLPSRHPALQHLLVPFLFDTTVLAEEVHPRI